MKILIQVRRGLKSDSNLGMTQKLQSKLLSTKGLQFWFKINFGYFDEHRNLPPFARP